MEKRARTVLIFMTGLLSSALFMALGCSESSTPTTPPDDNHHDQDTIAPYVGINEPIWGASISGTVTIVAEASDASGIEKVFFAVRDLCGAVLDSYEDSEPPYETHWDAGPHADGGYRICAAARDSAGNTSDWKCVDVYKGTIDMRISGFSPPATHVGGSIRINGEHFGAQTGTVTVNGKDAQIVSWSDAAVAIVVPQGVFQDAMMELKVTADCVRAASSMIDVTPPGVTRLTDNAADDGEPTFSPDGNWIYFSSRRSGSWDIWRMSVTGGEGDGLVQLTTDSANDNWADANPTAAVFVYGSQMVTVANLEGDYEIFTTTGSTTSQITHNDLLDRTPHWSPTNYMGYSIAYCSYIDSAGYEDLPRVMLYSNTEGSVRLTAGENPTFSPNGREVVYQYNDNLYTIGVDGGNLVQLTSTQDDSGPHWGWASNKIVFQRFGGYTGSDIYVMNPDGTGQAPLVATMVNEYSPAWSPDGTKVVYAALRWSNLDIYVYELP